MYVVESIEGAVGRITGASKLAPRDLAAHLRRRKPRTTRFKDDGDIPNNARSTARRARAAKRRSATRKRAA